MFTITETLLHPTHERPYAHVRLLDGSTTLLTRHEYENETLFVTRTDGDTPRLVVLPTPSIESSITTTYRYAYGYETLAKDIAAADTLIGDSSPEMAIRYLALRLGVGYEAFQRWCEYDAYYGIGAIVGVACESDTDIATLRKHLPPTLHGYVMTPEEIAVYYGA